MTNLVAVQMCSTPDVDVNFAMLNEELKKLPENRPTLVVLPECFACFGASDKALLAIAETSGCGPIQQKLRELAKKYALWLVAGSIPLKTDNPDKFTASCLLIDDKGEIKHEYQKIHMFDVQVADNTGSYAESRSTQAGNQIVVADTPFGKLGLAVCYDLRFPGLFAQMSELSQLDVIALPAAFTYATGEAHWQALLAARAIENQCYVIAANQSGIHANKRHTFGHSCIISPWGETLVQISHQPGIVQSQLDNTLLADIRRKMPVNQHNKFRSRLV
ncbi:MAG: putative amidohydrolase [Paraglaciecola sp.]